jgi:hypothetical protein
VKFFLIVLLPTTIPNHNYEGRSGFQHTVFSIIENHPCVYDYNTKEYFCRIAQDKTWENIGKEIGATG